MFDIWEYLKESLKSFFRDFKQSFIAVKKQKQGLQKEYSTERQQSAFEIFSNNNIYSWCKEYADGGDRTKCISCNYHTCYRRQEALGKIKAPKEEYSASGQRDTKGAEEKAQAGSSQHIKGAAGSGQGGKKMKIYIAGAITDNPNYKEQFNNAEERLKEAGHEVINPVKNQGYTYRELINAGLFQLMSCDAIYLLKGYEHSTGATLEHNYARSVGIEIMREDDTKTEELVSLLYFLTLGRDTACNEVRLKRESVILLIELLEEKLSNARCQRETAD